MALRDLPAGAPVHKYGQSIGVTTRAVTAGEHVHSHNLGMDLAEREHELATSTTSWPCRRGHGPRSAATRARTGGPGRATTSRSSRRSTARRARPR
ncbi:SAF domain-containing protein [Oerskovia sp. M15]